MDNNGNNGNNGNDGITSTNFDYDIYSGGSAGELVLEYARKEEEERKKAEHEAALKKKADYRRRFEGMSADEVFGSPIRPDPTVATPMPEGFEPGGMDGGAGMGMPGGAEDTSEGYGWESPEAPTSIPGEIPGYGRRRPDPTASGSEPGYGRRRPDPAPSGTVPGYGRRRPDPAPGEEGRPSAADIYSHVHTEEEAEAFFTVYHHLRHEERSRERMKNKLLYNRYRTDEEMEASAALSFRIFACFMIGIAFAKLLNMTFDCYMLMGAIGSFIGSMVYHTGIKNLSVTDSVKKSWIEIILIFCGISVFFV